MRQNRSWKQLYFNLTHYTPHPWAFLLHVEPIIGQKILKVEIELWLKYVFVNVIVNKQQNYSLSFTWMARLVVRNNAPEPVLNQLYFNLTHYTPYSWAFCKTLLFSLKSLLLQIKIAMKLYKRLKYSLLIKLRTNVDLTIAFVTACWLLIFLLPWQRRDISKLPTDFEVLQLLNNNNNNNKIIIILIII
jgi:hypothetical protein